MMQTTMAFSIANKHGNVIAMMTVAPKKANISKNNHGNGDCSKNKTKNDNAKANNNSREKQQLCQQKQQQRQQQNNNQQTANSKLQSTSTRVGPMFSAGSTDDLQVLQEAQVITC